MIVLTTTTLSTAGHQANPNDDDAEEIDVNSLKSAESGGGKSSSASDDSDERKTLSQQVADGKYGLIQRELFSGGGPSVAPGVLSYSANPEVPKDNSDNLGGLAREEIWLAEDHLLVLRGGHFDPDEGPTPHSIPVPPIDDYRAPNRQVKIPLKPKVPPPFPVQLSEGGPIQILAPAPPEDDVTAAEAEGATHGAHKADTTAGRIKKPHASRPSAVKARPENYGGGAPEGPGLRRPFPPGPAQIDEDDPSIYYPPPYSFFYPKDNTSAVPPGPLVPGIVLPPPPDFFGRLDPPVTTTRRPITTSKPSSTTMRTTTMRTTTPVPTLPPVAPVKIYVPPVTTTATPPVATQGPKPVYFEYFEQAKPALPPRIPQQPSPPRTYISSTAVPLRAFFKTPTRPAQFYFYEEDDSINEVNTPQPPLPPRIYIATVARPQQPQQQYSNKNEYTNKNTNNFDRHIQRLRHHLQIQQQTQRQQRYRQPRPVYQYSFGYDNGVPETQTPAPPPRYSVQIQPSVDYVRPSQPVTPNPIVGQAAYLSQPITPNPIVAQPSYYTKQEGALYEDITKKYFTMFGQKLTSPLPPLLRDDTIVNYRRPLPPPNPHSEYLGTQEGNAGGPGTFISYRLPGDGAHFYFLTPQLAQQQRRRSDGYYYPVPRSPL